MQRKLLKDKDWKFVEGEPCRLSVFNATPDWLRANSFYFKWLHPYAWVSVECPLLPKGATGFITHKMDLAHVQAAFETADEQHEVIVIWARNHLNWLARLVSPIMPKLIVWLCKKGAYELMADPDSRPDLQGVERFLAERPLREWKPPVMRN